MTLPAHRKAFQQRYERTFVMRRNTQALIAKQIHSYHSFVSLQEDANAGLIGPTIIYARGKMNTTMASFREFPILYNTYDESISWLSSENKVRLNPGNDTQSLIQTDTDGLAPGNETVWKPQLTNFGGRGGFTLAPTFYSINGYVYANTPTFEMCLNDNVSLNKILSFLLLV
jgi:hypothetical protein